LIRRRRNGKRGRRFHGPAEEKARKGLKTRKGFTTEGTEIHRGSGRVGWTLWRSGKMVGVEEGSGRGVDDFVGLRRVEIEEGSLALLGMTDLTGSARTTLDRRSLLDAPTDGKG
jgi:hypothetical protein